MHLADSLARRRRYAAGLIAGNHKQTRFFCFARRSVAAKRIFGHAGDRFAANLLACGFQSTFFLGGASGSFLAGFLAGYFTCFFTCDFEAAFVFGVAGGSFTARFFTGGLAREFKTVFVFGLASRSITARLFACSLARGFETAPLFGGPSGSFTTGLFAHGFAHSFKAPVFFGGAGGSFSTRFLARRLARSLANGVKAACLVGLADRGITRGGIARWSVAARLATAALPRRRSVATGIVPSRLTAATLAPGRFVAIRFAVRAIVIPFVARPAVAVTAMGLTLPIWHVLPRRSCDSPCRRGSPWRGRSLPSSRRSSRYGRPSYLPSYLGSSRLLRAGGCGSGMGARSGRRSAGSSPPFFRITLLSHSSTATSTRCVASRSASRACGRRPLRFHGPPDFILAPRPHREGPYAPPSRAGADCVTSAWHGPLSPHADFSGLG